MLRLKLIEKGETKKEFLVEELPAVLGRHGRSVVRIEDPSVSREHARLFAGGGGIFIADLNSRNGTFVNDEKVTRAPVRPGDRIRLGRALLLLEEGAAEKGQGAAAPEPAAEPEAPEPAAEPAAPEPAAEPEAPEPAAEPEAPEPAAEPEAPEPAAEPKAPEPAARPAAPEPATEQAASRRAARPEASRRATRPEKTGGLPSAAGAGPGEGDTVRVRERILQYSRVPARRKGGILWGDFFQLHPSLRIAAILLFLLLAVGIFFLARWLAEEALPAPWEKAPPPAGDGGNE